MELFTKEKNLNERMRKSYVPASMKVTDVTVRKAILAGSVPGGTESFNPPEVW